MSAGSHYAIADNVYGPYSKTGNSGTGEYGLNNHASLFSTEACLNFLLIKIREISDPYISSNGKIL